jgi:hypothetical protein
VPVTIKAFARDLQDVDWPQGFKPAPIAPYDGMSNPASWIDKYAIAINAAGDDDAVMANYLPVVLDDNVRAWLTSQKSGSIHSWRQLSMPQVMMMLNYLPVVLDDNVRAWLTSQKSGSIHSWRQLKCMFCDFFKGTWK